MHWAKAIYEYGIDGQKILPKRKMIEEIDNQLSTFEQEISANKEAVLQGEVSVNSIFSFTCRNSSVVRICRQNLCTSPRSIIRNENRF